MRLLGHSHLSKLFFVHHLSQPDTLHTIVVTYSKAKRDITAVTPRGQRYLILQAHYLARLYFVIKYMPLSGMPHGPDHLGFGYYCF